MVYSNEQIENLHINISILECKFNKKEAEFYVAGNINISILECKLKKEFKIIIVYFLILI